MAQFIKSIQNFAFKNNLWQKNLKIIIGVSGGPDSVCLLDILANLAKKYNWELFIAHVNYGLRGKDSEKDELFVRKLAQKYQIKFKVLKIKIPANKNNLENYWRNLRYDFLEKLRKKLQFDLIAVAHNQDDQAETVLMRLIRGAGLKGLSSMKPQNNFIIRPLLATSRAAILAYLKSKKILYRTDKSNQDLKFFRNKIRHQLIPYLEKNFNPTIKNTLSKTATIIADDYFYITSAAEKFTFLKQAEKKFSFEISAFLNQKPALQREILRNILEKLKKNLKEVEISQVEEILKIIKSKKSKQQKIFLAGLSVSRKNATIEIFLTELN